MQHLSSWLDIDRARDIGCVGKEGKGLFATSVMKVERVDVLQESKRAKERPPKLADVREVNIGGDDGVV